MMIQYHIALVSQKQVSKKQNGVSSPPHPLQPNFHPYQFRAKLHVWRSLIISMFLYCIPSQKHWHSCPLTPDLNSSFFSPSLIALAFSTLLYWRSLLVHILNHEVSQGLVLSSLLFIIYMISLSIPSHSYSLTLNEDLLTFIIKVIFTF